MTVPGLVRQVLSRRGSAAEPLVLRYLDTGGAGVPVVLQHGLCGDAAQTAEVFPLDSGARLLTLECRGHGQSPAGPVDELSIATFTEDVAAMIEATGTAPVIMGGISMGAAIALRLAVLRPGEVRGLILARPAWATGPAPANLLPNLEVGRLMARLAPHAAREAFLSSATARRLEREAPDNLTSLTGFFSREPQNITAELLQRISLDGPGLDAEALRSVRVPALVIGNAQDAIHPLELARTLAQQLPGARFVEVAPKSVDRLKHVAGVRSAIGRFIRSFSHDAA